MNNLKTAFDVLLEAGYPHGVIDAGMAYADELGWKDEDDRGSLALARILYDDAELELSPRAPWEPICCGDTKDSTV
jgi:hypothetical protein